MRAAFSDIPGIYVYTRRISLRVDLFRYISAARFIRSKIAEIDRDVASNFASLTEYNSNFNVAGQLYAADFYAVNIPSRNWRSIYERTTSGCSVQPRFVAPRSRLFIVRGIFVADSTWKFHSARGRTRRFTAAKFHET